MRKRLHFEPELHWEKENRLYWGENLLAIIEPKKIEGQDCYVVLHSVFRDVLLDTGEGLVSVWEDDEGPYLMADDGNVHEDLLNLYKKVLRFGAFTLIAKYEYETPKDFVKRSMKKGGRS